MHIGFHCTADTKVSSAIICWQTGSRLGAIVCRFPNKHATYHLADQLFFESLGKTPIIINAARGAIIDTAAIKKALIDKQIAGAIIDCWEKEPSIDLDYMNMVDIATPHIAGYSADGKGNATRMSLASIADFWALSKEPLSKIVIPQVDNPAIDWAVLDGNKLEKAILITYDPTEDHNRLISNPYAFSTLRGNYPLRREYLSYTVKNVYKDADKALLQKLGFILK